MSPNSNSALVSTSDGSTSSAPTSKAVATPSSTKIASDKTGPHVGSPEGEDGEPVQSSLGAFLESETCPEYDMEHSLMQEKRMRDFFEADEAALAADPTAAAAAATAAGDVIAAETEEKTDTILGLPLPVPYKSMFNVFRIPNPAAYYAAESLEERLPMLGAESVAQLCKTIVMENTKLAGEEDRLNSRYYLVVLQTKDKLNGERVKDLIKAENLKIGRRLGNKKLNFNFCPSFESLTGFKRNAVCPFASKTTLPVIISRPVLSIFPKTVFLGGGAPDLKVEISVLDLVRITNPIIGVVC